MPDALKRQDAASLGKRRRGRPPGKLPIPAEMANEVIAWIAAGKTLRDWCRIEGNPVYSVVYDWMDKDKVFAERFARARDIGQELIAQQCLAIADEPEVGVIETTRPVVFEGAILKDSAGNAVMQTEVKRADMIEHRKLRIHTRLQLLARWNPQKWGDAVNHKHSGTISLEALVSGSSSASNEPKQIEAEVRDDVSD